MRQAWLMVVARVVGLAAVVVAMYAATDLLVSESQQDANIGLGILYFLILMALACGWALWDGRRHGLAGRLVVVWLVVAVLFGLGWALALGGREGFESFTIGELTSLAVFFAGLVALPAGGGLLLGGALHGGTQTPHPR